MFVQVETCWLSSKRRLCVSHLCIFIVTVCGQKYFGYFFHATEEERKLRLVGGREKKIHIRLNNTVTAPTNAEALLTSFTTYFSRFSTVFSFREPCVKKHLILNACFLFFGLFKVEGWPWSESSPHRRGHPGTCSCKTWKGHRLWSRSHNCRGH